jgi:hypothetical protein
MNIVGVIGNARKRKVKRLSGPSSSSSSSSSTYYPSAFINKPCDQLFGPQPLDCSLNNLIRGGVNVKQSSFDISNQSFNDDPLFNKSLDESMVSNGSLDVIRHAASSSLSLSLSKENVHTSPTPSLIQMENSDASSSSCCAVAVTDGKFNYIPAPKWNKLQNSQLEELFRKSRYPKPSELKQFAQRLNVMDGDIEVICLFFFLIWKKIPFCFVFKETSIIL